MKSVADIPWDDLRIGDRVISANGQVGTIARLDVHNQGLDCEDYDVAFQWENGGRSAIWHFWCDKVTYKGQ